MYRKQNVKCQQELLSCNLKIRNLERFQMFSLTDHVENKLHQYSLKYITVRIMLCMASRQLCSKPWLTKLEMFEEPVGHDGCDLAGFWCISSPRNWAVGEYLCINGGFPLLTSLRKRTAVPSLFCRSLGLELWAPVGQIWVIMVPK